MIEFYLYASIILAGVSVILVLAFAGLMGDYDD